jgi:hypothetical protein
MGSGLHSRTTATSIADHIASEIKTKVFKAIVEKQLKICIIVDEASTIASTSTKDLAVMLDILEEIALLSVALQARDVNPIRAESLIKRSIKVFEYLQHNKGAYEEQIESTLSSNAFQSIEFVNSVQFRSIPREQLLAAVVKSLQQRLMVDGSVAATTNQQHSEMREVLEVIEPASWNSEEIVVPWLEGEKNLTKFQEIFHCEISKNDFRDYVENVVKNFHDHVLPPTISRAKQVVNTIAVSSAEAERGFSLMNFIISNRRSRLIIRNVANSMVINLLGKPLVKWDPSPYVKTWLRKHRSADDKRVKTKKATIYSENELSTWDFLE